MTTPARRFLALLAGYALLIVLLHGVVEHLPQAWAFWWYPQNLVGPDGRLAPAEWLWGVYPFTYFPMWLRWLLAVMAVGLIGWAGFGRRMWHIRLPFPQKRSTQIIISALSFGLFWIGRVVHTRWGDAYLLVTGMAHPDVRLTYNWQAPLDTYLHARLFQLGERLWGWADGLPAYWWLSSLAGALAVWVLLRLASEIGRTNLERWTIFGIMATLGAMQLFFGYPENYTLISLLILTYLLLAWRVVQGKSSLWMPSIVLALALGFHPATLVLQPSLWLLALLRRPGDRPTGWLARAAALILPPVLVLSATAALMTSGGFGLDTFIGAQAPGGGDHRWLVPLTQINSPWEYYTLFSRGHLLDLLNQQWLVAPFTVPVLILLVIFYRRSLPRDRFSAVLLTAAAAYWLLIVLWNPDYGGQRDWDLFAPAAWPATLLAAYWLTRAVEAATLTRAAIIIIVVQAMHTAAWVYSNTRPWTWN